jgi:hypothetical protein
MSLSLPAGLPTAPIRHHHQAVPAAQATAGAAALVLALVQAALAPVREAGAEIILGAKHW